MLAELEGYDWKEAFGYAGEPDTNGSANVEAITSDSTCPTDPFTREDVEFLEAKSDGESDGDNWLAFGRLKDGRWFCLSAGCDYTGWDCLAGGEAAVGRIRAEVIQYGMTDGDRQRLGIALPT